MSSFIKILLIFLLTGFSFADDDKLIKFTFKAQDQFFEGLEHDYLNFVVNSPEQLKEAMAEIKRSLGSNKLDSVVRGLVPKDGFRDKKTNEYLGFKPNKIRSSILAYGDNILGAPVVDIDLGDFTINEESDRAPSAASASPKLSRRARWGNWFNRKGKLYLSLGRTGANGGVAYYSLTALNMPPIAAAGMAATLGSLSGFFNYITVPLSNFMSTYKYEHYLARWFQKKSPKLQDSPKLRKRFLDTVIPSLGRNKSSGRTFREVLKEIGDKELPKLKFDRKFKKLSIEKGASLAERSRAIRDFLYFNTKWGMVEFLFIGIYKSAQHALSATGMIHIFDPLGKVLKSAGITSIYSVAGQGLWDLSIGADFAKRSNEWGAIESITKFTGVKNKLKADLKEFNKSTYSKSELKSLFDVTDKSRAEAYQFYPDEIVDEFIELFSNDNISSEDILQKIDEYSKNKVLTKAQVQSLFENTKNIREKSFTAFANDLKLTSNFSLENIAHLVSSHRGYLDLQRTVQMMAGSLAWAAAMVLQTQGVEVGDFIFYGLGASGIGNYLRLKVKQPKLINVCSDYF